MNEHRIQLHHPLEGEEDSLTDLTEAVRLARDMALVVEGSAYHETGDIELARAARNISTLLQIALQDIAERMDALPRVYELPAEYRK